MPLEVHVVSPEREVHSGTADMVVAKGVDGDVGILPGHAPMLISLTQHRLRIIEGGRETPIEVSGGFLHVTPGTDLTRVDVLAETAKMEGEGSAEASG